MNGPEILTPEAGTPTRPERGADPVVWPAAVMGVCVPVAVALLHGMIVVIR